MDTSALRRQLGLLEQAWRDHPARFTRLTGLQMAALLGLAGLPALLGLLVLLLPLGLWLAGGSGWWWALAPLGAALLWASAALWRPELPEPDGVVLPLSQLPRLNELLQHLTQAAHARPLGDVCLTPEQELRVRPTSPLGLLGGGRPQLRIGLPLLMGLDGPQFAALLAREMHGLRRRSLAAWIARWRQRWQHLLTERLPEAPGPRATGWGLLWWHRQARGVLRRALVVERLHGPAADAWAARWTGTTGQRTLADALLAQAVQARYLARQFWPQVWAAARGERRPNAHPMRDLRVLMRQSLRHPEAPQWAQDALRTPAAVDAPDFSLRVRLQALVEKPAPLAMPTVSAAEILLGQALPGLAEALDSAWQTQQADAWLQRHLAWRQQAQWLDELNAADAEGPLEKSEALFQGRLTQALSPPAEAAMAWRRVIDRHAAPAEARLGLARALLDEAPPIEPQTRQPELLLEQAEALRLLQTLTDEGRASATYAETLAADPRWRVPAAQLLIQQLGLREDFAALQAARVRLRALEDEAEAALTVLRDFQGEQKFLPGGLPTRVLRPVLALLQGEHAVGRAWHWRKTSTMTKGWALHLLVIERSRTLVQPDPQVWGPALTQQLAESLPLDWCVIDLAHPEWKPLDRTDLVQQFRADDAQCIHTGLARKA
ncbi:hypothetical protein [Ideonella oryzae]|uniref:Peptidase M48 domain-containing protein n=1 Tax=Ideonella oryzae TaxID=2937441 RepID=A0ABT1BK45_9BURK|nr:hypothetical protein [Ideonella oryzae]MCO5976294.1 hypothetical protein [Ideonella oryzae]